MRLTPEQADLVLTALLEHPGEAATIAAALKADPAALFAGLEGAKGPDAEPLDLPPDDGGDAP